MKLRLKHETSAESLWISQTRKKSEETQVINVGHNFVMLYMLWLQLGDGTFKVEYNPELIDAECFENNDNRVQAQIREIRKVLCTQLAGVMSSEAWIAKVESFHCLSQI